MSRSVACRPASPRRSSKVSSSSRSARARSRRHRPSKSGPRGVSIAARNPWCSTSRSTGQPLQRSRSSIAAVSASSRSSLAKSTSSSTPCTSVPKSAPPATAPSGRSVSSSGRPGVRSGSGAPAAFTVPVPPGSSTGSSAAPASPRLSSPGSAYVLGGPVGDRGERPPAPIAWSVRSSVATASAGACAAAVASVHRGGRSYPSPTSVTATASSVASACLEHRHGGVVGRQRGLGRGEVRGVDPDGVACEQHPREPGDRAALRGRPPHDGLVLRRG